MNLNRRGGLRAMRILMAGLGMLLILGVSGCGDSDGSRHAADTTVTTTRDDKGVFFITGGSQATLYDIFEAMGYAVATDRLWQAEKYRRSARGHLAEIFGPDYLPTDMFLRTIGYSDQELADGFAALDAPSRETIDGYVAGFNRRIAEIRSDPTLLPFEFRAVGNVLGTTFLPADWTPSDILAWLSLMLRNFDSEGYDSQPVQLQNAVLYQELMAGYPAMFQAMFNDLRWVNDPEALTYIEEGAGAGVRASEQVGEAAAGFADISEAADQVAGLFDDMSAQLKKINALVKMGSYAWVVSGAKTADGNPILYSGPQMGFEVPSIVMEGSIRAGGLAISGMTVPGIPGIIIGRTPHHAWSMQVGHAHTVDYYLEPPAAVQLHRTETIKVAGQADVTFPVYRSAHGPIINPLPFDPSAYQPDPANPIVAWKYAHWGFEFDSVGALLALARAQSMDEFGQGIERVAVSQHFCYADRDGNIAYWMSGRDPLRPAGEWRLPQGLAGPAVEWDAGLLRPRSTERNGAKGYYCGWNNKTAVDYGNAFNNLSYYFGPFHRAHVVDEALAGRTDLTFAEIRDLALDIAATDSFGAGGNPWDFVAADFRDAVLADPTAQRQAALDLLDAWDGHFVAGGALNWAAGTQRADAWVLMDAWIRETIRLTFADELDSPSRQRTRTEAALLFNVLLRGLAGASAALPNQVDWFENVEDASAPQTAEEIIVTALDNVLQTLGPRPWNVTRGEIVYRHELIGEVHRMPFASRSTYAHCVEYGPNGPLRIESMFPLGQSGDIRMGAQGQPVLDANFLSMAPLFDAFTPRSFPVFD